MTTTGDLEPIVDYSFPIVITLLIIHIGIHFIMIIGTTILGIMATQDIMAITGMDTAGMDIHITEIITGVIIIITIITTIAIIITIDPKMEDITHPVP